MFVFVFEIFYQKASYQLRYYTYVIHTLTGISLLLYDEPLYTIGGKEKPKTKRKNIIFGENKIKCFIKFGS